MVTTVWQAAFGVAQGFSSLMGYAFSKVDNNHNLHGWQWLHILMGILSLSSSRKSNERNPSSGLTLTYSHHLGVPPRFANQSSLGYQGRKSQIR